VQPSIRAIADEIHRYCLAHPDACDSVEGIAWWLVRQRHDEGLSSVRAAVDVLVAEGHLTPHALADGSTIFCCRAAGARP